jgi:hypothetical protein
MWLYRLRKNSRFCLSEGAGGFSPLNKANEIKGLLAQGLLPEAAINPFSAACLAAEGIL